MLGEIAVICHKIRGQLLRVQRHISTVTNQLQTRSPGSEVRLKVGAHLKVNTVQSFFIMHFLRFGERVVNSGGFLNSR